MPPIDAHAAALLPERGAGGHSREERRRWLTFGVLCAGILMIVLDTTIVNVALPSIKADLGFADATLAWVVNAYMLTFGGFLLLSGRLGDLFGSRRIFLIGLAVFTGASLACGLATTQGMLIGARALQGFGGAVLSAVSLSIILKMFPQPAERAKAMGFYSFVAAGGGSLGVFLGGLLTESFDWHWNFLINLPIGVAVLVGSGRLLPRDAREGPPPRLDVLGAVTVTAALVLAVYAITNASHAGWASRVTLLLLGASLALLAGFLVLESRTREPLVPLGIFRTRSLSTASGVGVLWAAAMFAWFFMSALYMQLVLGYPPLQVGLAFLPANLIMAAFAVSLSARVVMRFGIRIPIVTGLLLAAAGLGLFAFAPEDGTFLAHILPGMLLLGVGAGMAMNPVLLAAMRDVPPRDSGLASGIVNTAFMMGGALGLASLATLAAGRTASLTLAGAGVADALTRGYHAAFLAAATFALVAAALAGVFLRAPPEEGPAAAGLAHEPGV